MQKLVCHSHGLFWPIQLQTCYIIEFIHWVCPLQCHTNVQNQGQVFQQTEYRIGSTVFSLEDYKPCGGFGWKKKQLTEYKFFYNFIVLRSKPQILSWMPITRQYVYYRQKVGVFQKYTKLKDIVPLIQAFHCHVQTIFVVGLFLCLFE